jgi:DNA-binding MarR family transcriptional regulator
VTKWLDGDERSAWLALAGLMMKVPGALDAQLQRDADLTFFEYMVLAMLSEQPDLTMRMTELATITNASPSRLSHVARRLQERGLLDRARDCDDARSVNATLTQAGVEQVVAAAPRHVEHVRRLIIDVLTPDHLAQLTAIGGRIMAQVDPDWCPPAAG